MKKILIASIAILLLVILWFYWLSGFDFRLFIPLAQENHWELIQWTIDSL
jgi:hypothetical protein